MVDQNDSTIIPTEMSHRLENPGKGPFRLIEVQSGSCLGADDGARVEEVYVRDPCSRNIVSRPYVSSISIPAHESDDRRARQDLQVEEQRPVLDIVRVVTNPGLNLFD